MNLELERIKKNTIDQLEELFWRITLVNSCIIFYKQMNDALAEYPDKMNASSNYFNSVTRAYDYVIIIELAKMHEDNKKDKPISIPSVLRTCKIHKLIFEPLSRSFTLKGPLGDDKNINYIYPLEENLKKIDEIVVEMNDNIQMVKDYRDQYFAHNDKKYFNSTELLIQKYPFDFNSFESLSGATFKIIDMLYKGLTNENLGYPSICRFDFYNLIENLETEN